MAATRKQRKVVEQLVANGGKSVAKAMRDAGYSPKTARSPKKVTATPAFAELLEEYGLTDGLLINALVEDIKSKAGNRKQELELGFKVKGHLKDSAKITDPAGRTLFLVNMEPDGK